jgi:solute carrier family 13 (sodium-dependent dicarboxylate transporter), member 2/3/5
MTDAAGVPTRAEMDDAGAQSALLGRIGLIVGPAVAGALLLAGPPEGLTANAWAAIALLALVVVWWVTEAIPVAATSLLPLVGLPLVAGVKPLAAAAPYADPVIFLFIGGFMLAAAVERWGLHRRFAVGLVSAIGVAPGALLAGCLLAAGLLSMWISNTATALMLMPIAIGIAAATATAGAAHPRLAGALAIAIAYAASIGGVATPVGSPTNLVAMGWLERNGLSLAFLDWMAMATPLAAVMLAAAWIVLRFDLGPAPPSADLSAGRAELDRMRDELGPMSEPERRVMIVFGLTALAWVLREQIIRIPGLSGVSDMQIAMAGALALFLVPSGRTRGEALIDWPRAERIPWGIALLFGAGLSMAAAMETLGVTEWLAGQLSFLGAWAPLAILAGIVALTVFLSEFASNTATLTAFLPVVGAVAAATGMPPLYLVFGAAMGASLAFMMPVGTPPNAIAYATGQVEMKRMIRVGLVLNLVGIGLITLCIEVLGPLVLD